MNICVFDTETTSLDKPFCYNIGYGIWDTDTLQPLLKREFVIEQVWHNLMLFQSAYYANKRPLYVDAMRKHLIIMDKWGYVMQTMRRDFKNFDVQHAFAQNSPFDVSVFAYCCDWFKTMNPLDEVQTHDIRGHIFKTIAFTNEYQKFCDDNFQKSYETKVKAINPMKEVKHGLGWIVKTEADLTKDRENARKEAMKEWYTESGNYSTNAEITYRFISGNTEFNEDHTALSDAEIEFSILSECVARGAEWCADYKIYATAPKIELKEFEVIDADNHSHKFKYTAKRNINGGQGIKFTIKEKKQG